MLKVSVIIPNYNHASFLKQRIDSIIQQQLPPYEIIILDDNSSDNSRDVIESYRGHPLVKHIVYNDTNSGSPFKQWVRGIKIAVSPWIWIAESDDVAKPDFLKKAEERIDYDPGIGVFYCDSNCLTPGEPPPFTTYAEAKNRFFGVKKWSDDYINEGRSEVNEVMKWICTINNSSAALFRKELTEDFLNVLETYIYHGDWYFELAVSSRTKIAYNAKAMNDFRIHNSSFLRETNKLQAKLECFRILDFLYEENYVTDKKKLIDFFTLQYLGYGFLSDGIRFGRLLFRSYAAINKKLSKKVWRSLVMQKLKGKKHRRIF